MKAFFVMVMVFFASIFGAHPPATQPSQPLSTQAAAVVVANNPPPATSAENSQTVSSAQDSPAPPQTNAAATAVAPAAHAASQPSEGQVLGASTDPATNYVTQDQLTAVLSQLQSSVDLQLYGSGPTYAAGGVWNAIAASNKIDNLSGTTITNPIISGGSISGISISASDLSGVLPVASGGTGWASINVGSLIFGGGSSPIATSSNLYWDNSNGRLGIGTSSPLTTLSIQGTAGANDVLNVASSTGASILYVNAAGNVGIGNVSPTQALDVTGDVNSSGGFMMNGVLDLYENSSTVAQAVLDSAAAAWMSVSTTTTWYNLAIGHSALGTAQTFGSTANTAIGYYSLNHNTSGSTVSGFPIPP